MNLLLCDNTPIARLLQVVYHASLYGSCKIIQHLDPTSNGLSSGRKVNIYENNANKMPFHTCPDLTVPLMHVSNSLSKYHPCKVYKATPYMPAILQTKLLLLWVK